MSQFQSQYGHAQRSQPESFRARVMTASLTVRNLDASIAWYRDVLGFTVGQEYGREGGRRAVAIKAGTVELLLGQDDGAKGWDRVKGQGISLQLTTAQDIDQIAERIKARGTELETEPVATAWGSRLFRVRDPDGFTLVISSDR